jgi:hypothetical protein
MKTTDFESLSQSTSPLLSEIVVAVSTDVGVELLEPIVVCVVKMSRSEFTTTKKPIAIIDKKATTASPIFFESKPDTLDLPLDRVFVGSCDGRTAPGGCNDLPDKLSAGRAGGSEALGETDPG